MQTKTIVIGAAAVGAVWFFLLRGKGKKATKPAGYDPTARAVPVMKGGLTFGLRPGSSSGTARDYRPMGDRTAPGPYVVSAPGTAPGLIKKKVIRR